MFAVLKSTLLSRSTMSFKGLKTSFSGSRLCDGGTVNLTNLPSFSRGGPWATFLRPRFFRASNVASRARTHAATSSAVGSNVWYAANQLARGQQTTSSLISSAMCSRASGTDLPPVVSRSLRGVCELEQAPFTCQWLHDEFGASDVRYLHPRCRRRGLPGVLVFCHGR